MTKYERVMDSIAHHILNHTQSQPLLSAIAGEIQKVLEVDGVSLYQEQDNNYSIAIAQALATTEKNPLPLTQKTIRDFWCIPDDGKTLQPIEKEYLDSYSLKALIILPLGQNESIWGTLRVYHHSPRLWTELEIAFLQRLPVQIDLGLQKCQLCQPLTQSEVLINQLASSLVYIPSENFFNILIRSIVEMLQADYAFVSVAKSDTSREVEILAGFQDGKAVIHPFDHDPTGTPCEKVLKEQRPQIHNTNSEEIFAKHNDFKSLGVINYLGVPLIDSNQKAIGVLCIMQKTIIDKIEYKQKMLEIFAIRASAEIENRQNQKNIQEKERRYKNLIETAPIAIFQTDKQGNCIYVNRYWREITDTTDSNTLGLGLTWIELIHPDDLEAVSSNWVSSIKNERMFQQEFRFLLRDGSIRSVYAQAAPEYDGEGETIGYVGTIIDITERKSAELALKDSEKLYRKLVETACEGIWMLNAGGNTTFTNPMICEMLGYTTEEMLGKSFLDFMDESEHHLALHYFEQRRQNIQQHHDFKFRRRDGSTLWTLISTNALLDEEDKFIGALGMLTDISERKCLEDAIQQVAEGVSAQTGEIFFRSLVQYLATILVMDFSCLAKLTPDGLRAETLAVYGDGKIQPNFQYDLKGTPCANVVAGGICYHPAHIQQLFPEDQLLIDMGIESYLGTPLFDTNNKCIGLLVVLSRQPMPENSLPIRILQIFAARAGAELERQNINESMEALIADRTSELAQTVQQLHRQIEERIQAEKRYRNLVNTLPYGVQENDMEGTITYTNPAYDKIYGYELGETLNTKIWDKLTNSTDKTLLQHYLKYIIHEQPEPTSFYATNITKSGKLIDIQIDWTYKRNEQGQLVGLISIISDITERRYAEKETKRALLKERQLNQLKSQFIDTASHEFRTPLTIIIGSIKFLLKRYSNLSADKINEHLLRIQSAGLEINELIEDLLALSRADANKIQLSYDIVNIEQFCNRLLNNYQSLDELGHVYNLRLGQLPNSVSIDEKLLKHIINNLLSNAKKYSPENSPIDLSVERQGNNIVFQVTDRGIGIPHQDHPYIFESFHRATNVGNRSGTGLGLSISKKYAQLLGGNITFISEINKGSTFTVTIPALAIPSGRNLH
ncbi:MAG: Sensor histidine kinase RcsC [Chroococcopsis gigantea SAG 12.99]|jgi:PAS domain S-box-containing protein|nr:Sensor histidine kinase RcsC [Chroococcopsis gigantea SAG 12.99]